VRDYLGATYSHFEVAVVPTVIRTKAANRHAADRRLTFSFNPARRWRALAASNPAKGTAQ
jgi:hypothetical protein